MSEKEIYYRRNLSHYNPPHATFFITFRLSGSLPKNVVMRMREQYKHSCADLKNSAGKKQIQKEKLSFIQKKYFVKFDDLLDGNNSGPHWLKEEKVALMVLEALKQQEGKIFGLHAAVIMPNHIHIVVQMKPSNISESLYRMLQSLKSHTALEANKILRRFGAFWQHESYDHVVRDEKELERTILYILNNPVKAKFVHHPHQWCWLYLHPDFEYLLDSLYEERSAASLY